MSLLSRTSRDDVDVASVLSNLDRLGALEGARQDLADRAMSELG